jgi:acyl dehydratase
MPLNKSFEGRSFAASVPWEVKAEEIRQFADAIGDPNPVYRDEAAAKDAGYDGVIAPPTYLTKMMFMQDPAVFLDPELGLNLALIVHGEQEFRFERPVKAGDRLTGTPTITSIAAKGRNEYMVIDTEVRSEDGELVCTMGNTIVSRGTAEG